MTTRRIGRLAGALAGLAVMVCGCGSVPGETVGQQEQASCLNMCSNFSITSTPLARTAVAGGYGTTYDISTTLTAGAPETIDLSVSGLPYGVTGAFSPSSITTGGSSTLTLALPWYARDGKWALTVTGTGGFYAHSVTLTLTITGGLPVVTNGNFDQCNLTSWGASGAAGVSSPGVPTAGDLGNCAARVGSTNPTSGDSSISQTFVVPTGGATLAFWYKVTCPDSVTYDWATATLRDNTAGGTTTILANTCTNDGTWVQVVQSLAASAGHSVTLTLTSHDDNWPGDATYTLFDAVGVW